MYGKYSNNGIDLPNLEKDLYLIQDRTEMESLSLYCESDSLEVAGELIQRIGKRFDIDFIFADCSPVSFKDTIFGGCLQRYVDSRYGTSAFFTALGDLAAYKNPLVPYFSSSAAQPGLAEDEIATLGRGEEIDNRLARYINHNNASGEPEIKMFFLMPEDPSKDYIVNDIHAKNYLLRRIHGMHVATIGGIHQGHENALQNSDEYNKTLYEIIAEYGRTSGRQEHHSVRRR